MGSIQTAILHVLRDAGRRLTPREVRVVEHRLRRIICQDTVSSFLSDARRAAGLPGSPVRRALSRIAE